MTDLAAWFEGREPRPPGDLADAFAATAAPVHGAEAVLARLREAAAERLAHALERPGRVRQSALDLLVADALVTYACEAALEAADLEVALSGIVGVGGPVRPGFPSIPDGGPRDIPGKGERLGGTG